MVPMRYIFEELGALVEYDTDTSSINVSYSETPKTLKKAKDAKTENEKLKEVVWRECLNDVEEIFYKNATTKGLKVINYHSLMIGKAI